MSIPGSGTAAAAWSEKVSQLELNNTPDQILCALWRRELSPGTREQATVLNYLRARARERGRKVDLRGRVLTGASSSRFVVPSTRAFRCHGDPGCPANYLQWCNRI